MQQMENHKNSLANGLLVVVVIAAVFLVGLLIFGTTGGGVSDNKPVIATRGIGNLSDENQNTLDKERQAFYDETKDLRHNIHQKMLELQSELAKKNPDAQKVAVLHKDISKLAAEFDQKRLAFILEMKKVDPNFGRMGGWGYNDDDVNCPYYGRQYGRHMRGRHGYRIGPGMTERGSGMGPGY
jgi:hypothetical protein